MSMEEPENFIDHVHLIHCKPRQGGRLKALKEYIEALEAQGKRVVVIGMDSPRPPLLGAAMVHFGDPDMHVIDTSGSHFQDMLKEASPKLYYRPFAGKSILLPSLDHMFPQEESSSLKDWATKQESMEGNVPLIESIVSRASDILKLRFQDGSVGEITAFDEASVTVTDGVLTINGREIPPATLWLNVKLL